MFETVFTPQTWITIFPLLCLCFRLEERTGVMLSTQPSTGWQRRPETFADRFVFLFVLFLSFTYLQFVCYVRFKVKYVLFLTKNVSYAADWVDRPFHRRRGSVLNVRERSILLSGQQAVQNVSVHMHKAICYFNRAFLLCLIFSFTAA